MPSVHKHVTLITQTLSPEELVALSARLCYSRASVDDLRERVSDQDQTGFVNRIMAMGHESVLEHASFTFAVEGVSRVLLAQLTRHRIASFSVQSQRYVSYEKGFGYIIPPRIAAGEGGNEDARFVLPGACETRLIMTMNVRELRHFFSLRMCERAQWEIRALATEMHRRCMEIAPLLFADAGPGCLRGVCPEGEKTCGKAKVKREARKTMLDRIREQREQGE